MVEKYGVPVYQRGTGEHGRLETVISSGNIMVETAFPFTEVSATAKVTFWWRKVAEPVYRTIREDRCWRS